MSSVASLYNHELQKKITVEIKVQKLFIAKLKLDTKRNKEKCICSIVIYEEEISFISTKMY